MAKLQVTISSDIDNVSFGGLIFRGDQHQATLEILDNQQAVYSGLDDYQPLINALLNLDPRLVCEII